MQSPARFGPRGPDRRRPLLLFGAAAITLAALIALVAWFAPRPDRSGVLAVRIGVSSPGAEWLWPSAPRDTEREGLLLGGPAALRVPVSTGGSEDADAYLRRMLATLDYRGEPLEVQAEGSCLTTDERWIVRWTTFLARPERGGLTQLHLLVVRERSHDWMSPYLLSVAPFANAGGGELPSVEVLPWIHDPGAHSGGIWNEVSRALRRGVTYGAQVREEPGAGFALQPLLERHAASEWVIERPPDERGIGGAPAENPPTAR